MDYLKNINKIVFDDFGRPSGVLALNKEIGITSHDLVDKVRKILKTRKVGHAGALDPFASGLMLILVGKATKLSQDLMMLTKTYRCKIGIGISTKTQDTEGELLKVAEVRKVNKGKVESTLKKFKGGYEQFVPIFSSVKYKGHRLRELARACESFEITNVRGKRYVHFLFKTEPKRTRGKFIKPELKQMKFEIPKRFVEIEEIKLLDIGEIDIKDISFPPRIKEQIQTINTIHYVEVSITTSKGAYIRQFAEDFGESYGKKPAFLFELERTGVGKFKLEYVIDLKKVEKMGR